MNGPRSETLRFLYHSLGLESDNAFTDDQPGSILEITKRRLKDCKFAKDRIDSVRSCDRSMDQCGSATRRLIRLFDTEAGREMDRDTWGLEDGPGGYLGRLQRHLAPRDGTTSLYRI
jgi:hypothetical protein